MEFSSNMILGLIFIISTSISFTKCNVAQRRDHFDVEKDYSNDYTVLKNFVDKVKTRIAFGKDVAVYKWVEGEPILDKSREKFVLVNVEQTAKKMNKPFGENERLFFVDLMEATKLIEYALVSEWYANVVNGKTPSGSVSLAETRQKITQMQEELIELLSKLKDLQNSKACQMLLAKAIFETRTHNELHLRALQRAFGNFCKKNIDHKSLS